MFDQIILIDIVNIHIIIHLIKGKNRYAHWGDHHWKGLLGRYNWKIFGLNYYKYTATSWQTHQKCRNVKVCIKIHKIWRLPHYRLKISATFSANFQSVQKKNKIRHWICQGKFCHAESYKSTWAALSNFWGKIQPKLIINS